MRIVHKFLVGSTIALFMMSPAFAQNVTADAANGSISSISRSASGGAVSKLGSKTDIPGRAFTLKPSPQAMGSFSVANSSATPPKPAHDDRLGDTSIFTSDIDLPAYPLFESDSIEASIGVNAPTQNGSVKTMLPTAKFPKTRYVQRSRVVAGVSLSSKF